MDRNEQKSAGGLHGFSKSDCELAVLTCMAEIGKSPSVQEYNEWRKESTETWPTKTTIVKKYGKWNNMKRSLSISYTVDYREVAGKVAVRMVTDDETNEISGYTYIVHHDGENLNQIRLSRLIATLLVGEISELKSMHVHHKNHTPWLDYEDNIDVLTPKEHISYHNRVRSVNDIEKKWRKVPEY